MPVACAGELTDAKPIKPFRLLGEDLVVFRDRRGGYGVVGEHCPHRSASLAFGRVDEEGIRCPYHGWKFDCSGKCIEQPAEPESAGFKTKIKHTAYPVEKLGGLLWAYLGPEPKPLLPRWDVLCWESGKRWTEKHEIYKCNWLQPMENSVDPSHLYWLHGETAHLGSAVEKYEEEHNFIPFEFGIIKQRRTPGRKPGDGMQLDQHPLVFPVTLRHVFRTIKTDGLLRHNVQIRVPVDDAHTQVYVVYFTPSETDHSPPTGICRGNTFRFGTRTASTVWITYWCKTRWLGRRRALRRIAAWNISAPSMRMIILLRKILREQIEIVRRGGEPLGIIRDPSRNRLMNSMSSMSESGCSGSSRRWLNDSCGRRPSPASG